MTRNVTLLAKDDFYSSAFGFYSHISGAVDPRTGMYSASIDFPVGKGNRLRGPGFGFRLRYSPLSNVDHGFGEGWLLGMTELDLDSSMLTLDSGDTHRIDWLYPGYAARFPDRKLESFRLTPGAAMATATLEHSTGVVEHLERMPYEPSIMRTVRIASPSGDALHLAWTLGPNGRVVLKDVTDDEGQQLLGIEYPNQAQVKMSIAMGPTKPLEIVFERLGARLQRVHIPAIARLNEGQTLTDEEPVWAFRYINTLDPPYLSLLESIESPNGIHEHVQYDEHALILPRGAPRPSMPAVIARTRTLAASPIARAYGGRAPRTRFVQASTYRYDNHGYANFYGYPVVPDWQGRVDQLLHRVGDDDFRYGSIETQRDEEGATLCSIRRDYDHFHLIRDETTRRGTVVQQVTTAYGSVRGLSFDDQPAAFQLPHAVTTTVYDTRDEAMKQITAVRSAYDAYGNVQSRLDTASGIEERSTHYPLEGEEGLCPADPLQLVRRLKSTTVVPGPDGGPTLTTHFAYAAQPKRKRSTAEADAVYVQAVTEWTTLDETGQTVSESRQAFILDQGEQHGAPWWETQTVDGQTHTRELAYRTDAPGTVTLRTTHTTPDGIVCASEEVLALVGGLTLEDTDIAGNKTRRSYDNLARLTDEVHVHSGIDEQPASRWSYRVTRASRSVTRIGSTGLAHRQWLDEHGRLILQEEPLADGGLHVVREVLYDAFGEVVEDVASDRLADDRRLVLTTHHMYDDWGQPTDTTAPDGSHTRALTSLLAWSGEVMTRRITWQEADGVRIGGWKAVDIDPTGRQRREQTGHWDDDHTPVTRTTATWRYDGLGRCIETTDTMGRTTRQSWDHYDRLTTTSLPDGSVVTRTYAAGQADELLACIAVTPPGETTPIVLGTRDYDGLARLVRESSGSLVRTLGYVDGQMNAASEGLPGGGVIERTYDTWHGDALLTETLQGDRPRRLREATYAPLTGMPSTINAETGTMWIYTDYLGRMTEQDIRIDHRASFRTRTDLSPGGMEQAKTGVDGMRRVFAYDDDGRVARSTDYDTAGALVVESTFGYDAVSRPQRRESRDANGSLIEALVYDDLGRIARNTWTRQRQGTVTEHSLALVWRDDNKLTGKHWHDEEGTIYRTESMDYDLRGRLISHVIASPAGDLPVDEMGRPYTRQSFAYDCLDNLLKVVTTFVDGSEETVGYEHDTVDRDRVTAVVTSIADTGGVRRRRVVLRYDDAGHLVDDGTGRTFGWDDAGRLAFASQPDGGRRDYRYGPDGRVACVDSSQGTAYRYYDDGRLYGEYTDDDERRFLRADGVVIAESLLTRAVRSTWLLGTDPQGSVVMEAGDDTRLRTYGAYGDRDASMDRAHSGFGGESREGGSGCYLLGSRLYSPALRRFLSADTASPFDEGGLNRYAYCGGDPMNRIDPSGESWWSWLGVAIGVALGVAATVATGGALAGAVAAAAAGSITAGVSTPGMVIMVTSTVLEVTATAVDLASNIADEAGDSGTASILGQVAMGLGAAAAAPAALYSVGRASSRFLGRMRGMNAKRSPSVIGQKTYPQAAAPASAKEKWMHPGGQVVKLYRAHAVSRKIPHRVLANGAVVPHWIDKNNAAGGRLYAFDSTIDSWDVSDLLKKIHKKYPDNKPIVILSGAHGDAVGANYDASGLRTHIEPDFHAQDKRLADHFARQTNRKVIAQDIANRNPNTMAWYSQLNAHVIHAYCHSAADPVVMKAMNLDKVKIFLL